MPTPTARAAASAGRARRTRLPWSPLVRPAHPAPHARPSCGYGAVHVPSAPCKVRESVMRMRNSWTTAGCGIVIALVALAPRTAAAQHNPFDRFDAPPHVQNFTGGTVRELEYQFQYDLHVMGTFSGRRRLDRFDPAAIERPQPWKFYGRLGP